MAGGLACRIVMTILAVVGGIRSTLAGIVSPGAGLAMS